MPGHLVIEYSFILKLHADETTIDKCASNPCLNGATCNSFPDHYECTCTDQWSGVNCETGTYNPRVIPG